jgi:hemolysin III
MMKGEAVMQPVRTAEFKTPAVREPGSALTHLIGCLAAVAATPVLLVHASVSGADMTSMIGLSVFMMSMILLYGASTTYHTVDATPRINRILKKMDHMMIFVLIAGSYTPVCLTALRGPVGTRLLIMVWGLAAAGMIFKMAWVNCPKWVSSVIYIGMGWVCLTAMPQLLAAITSAAFGWLLAGGLIYTVGGVIYAMKFPVFHDRYPNFGCHELFHLFVMGGSLCHFIVMYSCLPY